MAQAVEFPTFSRGATVQCFQCCTIIGEAGKGEDKGYPPGRGQYGLRCSHCGATTFYDLVDYPCNGGIEYARYWRDVPR